MKNQNFERYKFDTHKYPLPCRGYFNLTKIQKSTKNLKFAALQPHFFNFVPRRTIPLTFLREKNPPILLGDFLRSKII